MIRPILPLALALALSAGGCDRRPDDVPVVVSAIGPPAVPADPNLGPLDPPARMLMGATAQGLVRFDAAGQIEPALAERWIVIDGGRSYIFRLRKAEWPDGGPVTAGDVVTVLRRAAAPESRNPLAPFLQVINEIVEMTPQIVEVRLRRPRPDLLKLFAQPELAVFQRRALGGSGPFRIQPAGGPGIRLRPAFDAARAAGEDFEDPRPADHIRLHGERAARALARFERRESDLVTGGTFNDWPLLGHSAIAPANVRLDPAIGLFGLTVASRRGFLAEAENRAAIAMALDRSALTGAVRPEWAPIDRLLPAQLDSARPPVAPPWLSLSLVERRAAAGSQVAAWRARNPGVIALRVALPHGPGATLLWAHVARALYAIGVRPVRVGPAAPAELRLVDQVAPYDSGRWYLATACAPCGDEAAALIAAARDAPTLEARSQRIAEADAALAADYAYIPIAQPLRWSIVALRLGAWQGNTRAWHPLNHLRNESE